MKMTANHRFPYDGRFVEKGQEIDVADGDAKVLVLIGHARYVTRNMVTGSEKGSQSKQRGAAIITKAA